MNSRRNGIRTVTVIESQLFRRSYSHEARIRFIGVWDTVGSLGIPSTGLGLAQLVNRRGEFHDTKLSTKVDAFQAPAIDERREPFEPTLWQPQSGAGDQRVEQVWFSGATAMSVAGTRTPPWPTSPCCGWSGAHARAWPRVRSGGTRTVGRSTRPAGSSPTSPAARGSPRS
jgi:hypothetical protein